MLHEIEDDFQSRAMAKFKTVLKPRSALIPEEKLLYAVLERAFSDCFLFGYGGSCTSYVYEPVINDRNRDLKTYYRSSKLWILSKETHPFSFYWVVHHLFGDAALKAIRSIRSELTRTDKKLKGIDK